MIRLGYFEHPSYVPLLQRTYELWRELEAATEHQAPAHHRHRRDRACRTSDIVAGTLAASRLHGLPHEVLDAAEAMRRFPAFRLPSRFRLRGPARRRLCRRRGRRRGVARAGHGPRRGDPDRRRACSRSSRETAACASRPAAAKSTRKAVDRRGRTMAQGNSCAGCRAAAVTRQVMTWFEPRSPDCSLDGRFPVFLLASRHGNHYGFPVARRTQRKDRQASPFRRDRRSGPRRAQGFRRPTRPRSAPALDRIHPGGGRPARRRQDLPLHRDARPRFHHRPAAGRAEYRGGVGLLGPRLQVRAGARRGACRSRNQGRDRSRHRTISGCRGMHKRAASASNCPSPYRFAPLTCRGRAQTGPAERQ